MGGAADAVVGGMQTIAGGGWGSLREGAMAMGVGVCWRREIVVYAQAVQHDVLFL